jgi:6-pyruvoyltetrahydropterin/6-carboxytetrahydropterin synthase
VEEWIVYKYKEFRFEAAHRLPHHDGKCRRLHGRHSWVGRVYVENTTSEEIAKWIFEKLAAANLPGLHAVEITETCTSGCIYSPVPHTSHHSTSKTHEGIDGIRL